MPSDRVNIGLMRRAYTYLNFVSFTVRRISICYSRISNLSSYRNILTFFVGSGHGHCLTSMISTRSIASFPAENDTNGTFFFPTRGQPRTRPQRQNRTFLGEILGDLRHECLRPSPRAAHVWERPILGSSLVLLLRKRGRLEMRPQQPAQSQTGSTVLWSTRLTRSASPRRGTRP